jgi:hypothetical protein
MKQQSIGRVAAPVTLTTITHIPHQEGYWEEALSILKLCLDSMLRNAEHPADLAVFDNGSCGPVRDYLLSRQKEGRLPYLVLSDENVSKLAAQDYLFHAAPGEWVAYADSDVLFFPGWLRESLACLEAFPEAGMVSGRPWRPLSEADHALVEQNRARIRGMACDRVEQGDLIPPHVLRAHAEGLNLDVPNPAAGDLRITRGDVSAFDFGSHFQFVTRREVIQKAGRLGHTPTGDGTGVRTWDNRLNDNGYIRLATVPDLVYHLGNSTRGEPMDALLARAGIGAGSAATVPASARPRRGRFTRFLRALMRLPPGRRLIHRLQQELYAAIYLKP